MEKKLTMGDIASMAGVGKSTISRYFNGGYVKDETRAKIKKIIDEYNYEPNTFAQSLKAKKSKIIGVIAPCLDSVVSSRVLMAIDDHLKKNGYMTLFINTNHNELHELSSIENLWRMNVDGIILLATHVTMTHQKIIDRLDIPVVVVAQKVNEGISIIYDDYEAGREVGHYAASKGHRHIAYVGVDRSDEAVGSQRRKGVYDGLNERGVTKIDYLETDFSFNKAGAVIERYFKKNKPTLMICATDNIALAAYKSLRERGWSMPEDISLIGFGGYESSSLLTPSLCTVRFDSEDAGKIAGETVLKLINEETVPKTQIIGYQFIKGGSVQTL